MPDLDASTSTARDSGVRVEWDDHSPIDATGGTLDLPASSLDVASLTLVGLPGPPATVAHFVGIAEAGGFTHGSRWGLLEPLGGEWRVWILTGGEHGAVYDRFDVGRLSDRDLGRWAPVLRGRTFRVVVFVEATPGFAGIEVRFRRDVVEGTAAPYVDPSAPTGHVETPHVETPHVEMPSVEASHVEALRVEPSRDELDCTPPPPTPEGWYADPEDGDRLRWWDGAAWTVSTHPR